MNDHLQRTLQREAAVHGVGYWTGRPVRVLLRPAAENTGLVFVRDDLPGEPRIPALVEHRIPASRRTVLAAGRATVEMVEHILAALAGMGVDNCEIWLDDAEAPGLDGSAKPYAQAIAATGVVSQDAPAHVVVGPRNIGRTQGEASVCVWTSTQSACCEIRYDLSYRHAAIGRQTCTLSVTPEVFLQEIAPARTFLLRQEADVLLAQGLGRHVSPEDLLIFDEHGPVDAELRFANECARHKLLDVLGDLALCGARLQGRVHAVRSGHALNAVAAQALFEGGVTKAPRALRRSA